MKRWFAPLIAAVAMAVALPALADGAPRLALIINQVDYQTLTPLPDTDQEASEIKDSLTQLGFDVTSARDLSVQATPGHPGFRQVLDDFRRKVSASPGAIVFVYYTGHGMADPTDAGGGENYLLGVDANIRVAADLPPSGIMLSDLKTQFSRAGTKALIIVLDACRDTPTLGKGVAKGLAPVTPDDNTLIAYSTDLGHIAETGVYAPVLAKELLKPGEKITDVFTNVQIGVSQETNQQQHPWVNNRIYDVICLASCEVKVAAPSGPGLSEAAQMEQTFWDVDPGLRRLQGLSRHLSPRHVRQPGQQPPGRARMPDRAGRGRGDARRRPRNRRR
ncbi:MAG: caspase family protein [Asticcacaulis sp.]